MTSMAPTRREFLGAAIATAAASAASRNFSPDFATALEAAAAVKAKRISSVELTELAFRRIDAYNPKLNAVILQFREQSLARAREADRALAKKEWWGPFHGVPITVKESYGMEGVPTTAGVPQYKDFRPKQNAVAIDRILRAGAIIAGKTNVPVMLADYQTYNPIYGTTNNPWDLTRTPGGSTGGGAAAVAAGLGCLTLGSDLSGSLRIPAHFCGVYGHKPSLELVSAAGFQPGPWDGSPGFPIDLAVVGPLARGARDLALSVNVLGGPNGDDAKAWRWRMPSPRQKRLKDFRIGYLINDKLCPVASDLREVYESVLGELGRSGAKMERGWPTGIDPQAQLQTYQYLLFAFLSFDISKEQR